MADFRTKLITLAGVATMFAGMAYGQATCTTATANAVFVRAEGKTEQVADTVISCATSATTTVTAGQTASITVYLSPSANITSATLGSGGTAKNESIAGLTSTFPAGGGAPAVAGSVSGNSVTFAGIVLPAVGTSSAPFTFTITNIKIDATSLASGSGVPTGVTETIFMSGTGIVPSVIAPAPTVAFATAGLTSIQAKNTTSNALCSAVNGTTSGSLGTGVNFQVLFNEGFADAFKVQGGSGTNVALGSEFTNHTETGYGITNPASNTATSGTRIKVVFANVPSGVTLYTPLSISNAGGTLTLTGSETGAFSAATASTASGAPASSAAVSVTSNSGTVIYEATTATTTGVGAFVLPVYFVSAAGAVTAPTTAVTATVSFGPIGSSANVPNFVSGASTLSVNGSTYSACSTTLLFPFVTNQLGFDTGIAVTNASSDLLASAGTKSLATAQSGTCSLTFFGAAAPAAAVVTPVVTSGTTYAATASSMAPGFQGYAIASCNFLYAHGFAFVSLNLGLNTGAAMGYLADVLPANRSSSVATAVSSTNTLTAGVLTAVTVSGGAQQSVSSNAPESWGH